MRLRLRNTALSVLLTVMPVVVRLLSRLVPRTRQVVVAGFPETEGNATETARALLRRYPGRVVWLREPGEAPREVRALAAQGMALAPKASLAGLWAYLRAEAVFFTHGLYGSPAPLARKPVVNLWHGDGPKDVTPRAPGEHIAGSYVVGSTPLFTANKCAAFGVPRERALLTGNPRTDQLWRPADEAALRRLGVERDYVVWMPTYRRARAVGAARASTDLPDARGDDAAVQRLVEGLRERGLDLVVKPHPMDADRRDDPRWVTVTEDDLVRAGVTLYEVLGASAGLVTDYSSVWVDYLLLDRPMAFLVTDRDRFSRGLQPADVLDWLPGEVIEGGDDAFERFLADLDASGASGAEQRAAVASRIGLTRSRTAADDLLEALAERGVLPLRPEGPRQSNPVPGRTSDPGPK